MSGIYGINEEKLRTVFRNSKSVYYNESEYKILKVGKPRPNKGECKTDVYISAESSSGIQEFKLSVKQRNADFLENKMNLDRAKEIFGPDAQKIISASTGHLRNKFTEENIVFFDKKHPTEAKSITLGWKFELLNKTGGEKSGLVTLGINQKEEVYSGINASIEKRNCVVNSEIIQNSGVANFILEVDSVIKDDANYYFQNIKPVQEYVKDKDIYFACKALNYRAEKNKWDGDRPLAVYVDWQLTNNKLRKEIVFDHPLEIRGNEVGSKVRKILSDLHISKINFNDLKQYLEPNVKSWKES